MIKGGQYQARHPQRLLFDGDASMFLQLTSPEDSEKLYELVHENREHLAKYQRWAKDIDFMKMHQAVQDSVARIAADSWLQYRLMVPQPGGDHRMIGTVTVYDRDILNARACLGVWLAATEQGKGYAHKACIRLLGYVFTAWNLRTVSMEINDGNEYSERLARQLGAVPTGEWYEFTEMDGEVVRRQKWVITRP